MYYVVLTQHIIKQPNTFGKNTVYFCMLTYEKANKRLKYIKIVKK